ncbi:MAG: (2Fe-2S)-binding protein [Candidatus Cloacimonetes bacterium]|nr:(2Fe-2S)-binding protein [Candidatus Cloacimonadota bacterium]
MKTIINRKEIDLNVADLERNLLDWLRESLDLTGAKNGCGIGVCGACTILVEYEPKRACLLKVKDIMNKSILTIEGLTKEDGSLHPLQQAFVDAGAIQCGFCTPAMVLTAHSFLLQTHLPTREQARKAIKGNLCRCTGYQQIIDAIISASVHYQH